MSNLKPHSDFYTDFRSVELLGRATFVTPDYQADFHNLISAEFPPELIIRSRRFNIPAEKYTGTIEELAEYAGKKLSRTGVSRAVMNLLPDAIHSGLIKSDDFFWDLTFPLTSRVSSWFDEAFD